MRDKKILGWDIETIKNLINFMLENKSRSLSQNFAMWGKRNGRQAFSVRNYYYRLIKLIKQDNHFANMLDLDETQVQKLLETRHFKVEEEKFLIEEILRNECSVRKTCKKLAGGDEGLMIRYQNKFRKIIKTQQSLVEEIMNKLKNEGINVKNPYEAKIIKMPQNSARLSNEDINSLFSGLVKLVQEETKKEIEDSKKQEKLELMKKFKLQKFNETKLQQENENLKNEMEMLKEELFDIDDEILDDKRMQKLKNYIQKLKSQNQSLSNKNE